MNLRRTIVYGLLLAAGGLAAADAAPSPAGGCAPEARDRAEWRLHGNPAKPIAMIAHGGEARSRCAHVATDTVREAHRVEREDG